jgi:hypothetical protein
MEMVLDRGNAPKSKLVGGPNHVVPVGEHCLIAVAMAADRTQLAAFLDGGGNYRI